MGFPANVPALWSFIGIIGSILLLLGGSAWMCYCYFPGGYKKSEVMDLGDYAMYVAQMKYAERKKKLEQAEAEEDEYGNDYDELYHEHGGYADEEEAAMAREFLGEGDGASEAQDIEGGEFYDGTTNSSSPSTQGQTYDQGGQTYDDESALSPNSQAATPSQRGLKSALKSSRDDQSYDDPQDPNV